MKFQELSHYSGYLNREMKFNVYGHGGRPVVVFPSSGGSHYEYADFGMIETCSKYIDQGKLIFFTPQSVDKESWLASDRSAYEMATMHNRYDNYIIAELIPYIKHHTGYYDPMITTGCSMGAFHAVNFLLRHPDVFDTTIALSGIYDVRYFTGDYTDFVVYENSPTDYLWNMRDSWFLNKYRKANIVVCTGQGNWEEQSIADTRKLQSALEAKEIPCWIDYWGNDTDHDWPWWKKQIVYYLDQFQNQGII